MILLILVHALVIHAAPTRDKLTPSDQAVLDNPSSMEKMLRMDSLQESITSLVQECDLSDDGGSCDELLDHQVPSTDMHGIDLEWSHETPSAASTYDKIGSLDNFVHSKGICSHPDETARMMRQVKTMYIYQSVFFACFDHPGIMTHLQSLYIVIDQKWIDKNYLLDTKSYLERRFKSIQKLYMFDSWKRPFAYYTLLYSGTHQDRLRPLKKQLERLDELPINWKDQYGNTILHYCLLPDLLRIPFNSLFNTTDCLRMIIERFGADPHVRNNFGVQPIHMAAMITFTGPLEYLLSLSNADIDSPTNRLDTPLALALKAEIQQTRSFYDAMIASDVLGTDYIRFSTEKETSFDEAIALYSDQDNVALPSYKLVELGANLGSRDVYGFTPIHYAANKNRMGVIKAMYERHPSEFVTMVNIANDIGMTPLIAACLGRHFDLMRRLVEYGANVNVRTREGMTPLLVTLEKTMNPDDVTFLIDHGANVYDVDDEGRSAYSRLKRAAKRSKTFQDMKRKWEKTYGFGRVSSLFNMFRRNRVIPQSP